MTTGLQVTKNLDRLAGQIEQVVILGDLSTLSDADRVAYYRDFCESLRLNWRSRPFDYLKLQGKLTLYARKDATDQLRTIHGVSITRLDHGAVGDLYVATAYARTPDGREDSEVGAVPIKGLTGEALANAVMKAITKAKRRVTLSICGLGMLDETEVSSIPNAPRVRVDEDGVIQGEISREPMPETVAIAARTGAGMSGAEFVAVARDLGFGSPRAILAALGQRVPESDADCKTRLQSWIKTGHTHEEILAALVDAKNEREQAAFEEELARPANADNYPGEMIPPKNDDGEVI